MSKATKKSKYEESISNLYNGGREEALEILKLLSDAQQNIQKAYDIYNGMGAEKVDREVKKELASAYSSISIYCINPIKLKYRDLKTD